MAKKLEMEPQSFRSDSEGAKAKLQGAIREVNIKFEGCVKYLPPLVKSHRNQVVHLNTSTPPAPVENRVRMALVQLKLRVCRWRGGEGYMWEMCKCRAEQRGSKCGLKCDLVHIAWNARAHPPTVWVGLIRPRHHSKNRMSCWGGIG